MSKLTVFSSCALALVISAGVGAAEFRARAVMTTADGVDESAQLFVSQGRMRKEYNYHGEPVVEILDSTRHTDWMCFRAQRTCFETRSLATLQSGGERPFPENPCEHAKGLICQRLGEEQINGRTAVKWEVVGSYRGNRLVTHQWIDKQTNIPLKREMGEGVVIELIDQGDETVSGRKTTKWEVTTRYPDGREEVIFQWLDHELGIAIRQEIPGSGSQELRDIQVGTIPDRLFETPEGYQVINKSEAQANRRVR
jgi:hypothetical protein